MEYKPSAIFVYSLCDIGNSGADDIEFVNNFVAYLRDEDLVMEIGCGIAPIKTVQMARLCREKKKNVHIVGVDSGRPSAYWAQVLLKEDYDIDFEAGNYFRFLDPNKLPPIRHREMGRQVIDDAISLEARVVASNMCKHDDRDDDAAIKEIADLFMENRYDFTRYGPRKFIAELNKKQEPEYKEVEWPKKGVQQKQHMCDREDVPGWIPPGLEHEWRRGAYDD